MGAKMRYTCNSFGAAENILNGKAAETLGHNTILRRISREQIAVRLHYTDIVIFCSDGQVMLNSGGYETVTTKDRINKFSPVGVTQKKGEWFLDDENKTPFRDFITIKDGVVVG